MAEQTLGDRDERLAANFDGTEFTECFPTSQGISFRSKLGTAASRDVTDFVQTANAPSDSAWTTVTTLLNGWTGTIRYIKRLGLVSLSIEELDGSASTDATVFTMPSGYRPTDPNIRSTVVDGNTPAGRLSIAGGTGTLLIAGTTGNTIRGSSTYPTI